jgi:hypothetical protein
MDNEEACSRLIELANETVAQLAMPPLTQEEEDEIRMNYYTGKLGQPLLSRKIDNRTLVVAY